MGDFPQVPPSDSLAAVARNATLQWSRRFLIGRRAMSEAITDLTSTTEEVLRARWRGRVRQVVVRTAPTDSRKRKLDEPVDPREIDPWQVDPARIENDTRQLVACPACRGQKKVVCATCGGSGVVGCSACHGAGRVRSARSGKIVQCRSCRGNGRRRCACRDGRAKCEPCRGRGKVERWLEIEETPFDRVRVQAGETLAAAFGAVDVASDFDRDATWPVAPIVRWSGSPSTLPAPEAERLARLGPPPVSPGERLDLLDIQRFEAPVTWVEYRIGGATDRVAVGGWNGIVIEQATSRRPFQRRALLLAAGTAGALIAGLAVAVWYAGRHAYFATTPTAGLLWQLIPALGLAGLAAVLPLVGWRPEAPRRLALFALPLLLLIGAGTTSALRHEPSLAHARERATEGDIDAALLEAAALADRNGDPVAAAFHDRLRLDRARATTEPEDAWQAAGRPFYDEAARDLARQHALLVTVARAQRLQHDTEYTESDAVLALILGEPREYPGVRRLRLASHLARGRICAERRAPCAAEEIRAARRDGFTVEQLEPIHRTALAAVGSDLTAGWRTVRSGRPLDERLAACQGFRTPFDYLDSLETPSDLEPVDRREVTVRCHDLERERAAREERARQREVAQREAARRSWARARLLCRDGTLSPTCVCGGSRRGCCSHHGGVAGCSAD
jgi:hypothetical protein